VLVTTPFIRECILDKEKTHLIPGAIAQGTSQYGMQSFDQSIFSLFEQKLISYEEAVRWASNVDEFNLKVQGIATTSEMTLDEMAKAGQATGGGKSPVVTRGKPAEAPRTRAPEITRFGSS
jgi:twitching motility protein PilT